MRWGSGNAVAAFTVLCLASGSVDAIEPFAAGSSPAGRIVRVGEAVSILETTLSPAVIRDGQTLELGYQLSGASVLDVQLGASLLGPAGELVGACEDNPLVQVGASVAWYSRPFLVNLPPGASAGLYGVTWTVDGEASGQASATQPGVLTVEEPLDVRIPILMYHKFGPIAWSQYWVTTSNFLAHMKALKAYHYTTITLQDLMDARAGLRPLPAKPILIAFDDGYENNYTDAYPVLSLPEIDFKATLFLPPGKVGGTNEWDDGDNLPIINHLTWEQLQAMHASGRIDIQSHTMNHRNVTENLSDSVLLEELVLSRGQIETHLQKTVRFVSWPYGAYDLRAQQAARAAGYFAAVAVVGAVETTCRDKWALRRVIITSGTGVDSSKDDFLMRLIRDPDVLVPVIAFGSTTFLDPATDQPLAANEVRRGDSVKIRLQAANWDQTSPVVVTLRLDNDGDHDNGIIHDSHLVEPPTDVVHSFDWGWHTFEWVWQVPADAPLGQYYAVSEFHDPSYVLAFGNSGWLPAFTVSSETTAGGDVNKDGLVDALDLSLMSESWSRTFEDDGFDPRCDLNSDGKVDVADLLILAASWGG